MVPERRWSQLLDGDMGAWQRPGCTAGVGSQQGPHAGTIGNARWGVREWSSGAHSITSLGPLNRDLLWTDGCIFFMVMVFLVDRMRSPHGN